MTIDTEHFKEKLEKEKTLLETELEKVAQKDLDTGKWVAMPPEDRDVSQADENTAADAIEGYEDNAAIFVTLEERYNDVKSGLDKIKHGVFGLCQICQNEIESDRLEANPSARTCKEHMQ